MILDRDLQSIQETRNLINAAVSAQKKLAALGDSEINRILLKITKACENNAEKLAKMAVEETGFGIWEDKVLKNKLGSSITYDYIKDMKTRGIIEKDDVKKIWSVAVPVGVVAALIPSTNPTSTVMYKALISLKAGNAVVFSPHPSAFGCISETVRIIREALEEAGGPADAVGIITTPTLDATNELMKNPKTGMILATGGPGMVKAAYSSGNPALGVGAGNAPAFIERTADISSAVRRIFASKCFDNGTICASEQSIITENCIADKVISEIEKQGGYMLNEKESAAVSKILLRSNGSMNPAIVGKNAQIIANMAGISVPADTRVLISKFTGIGVKHPYSRETLCPVLGFFAEENWEEACRLSLELLANEGAGHTLSIHSEDEDIIREFALRKPAMRIIVNAGSALAGVGATSGLAPAFTLGCGAVGGSATSDNVTPMNLVNIRRIAWGLKEIESLAEKDGAEKDGADKNFFYKDSADIYSACEDSACEDSLDRETVKRIAAEVLKRLSGN